MSVPLFRVSKDPSEEKRLVVLPLGTSFRIALRSLRARFLRSLITVVSLVLAISFYAYVSVNAIMAEGILGSGDTAGVSALRNMGYDIDMEQGQRAADNPAQQWILFLSLLVCVVGIVNTQLMAVTERYREIGTMKCLGALDRFVVRLFLIEAAVQGMAGAALGALFGALLALGMWWGRLGTGCFRYVDGGTFWQALAGAVLLGTFLSVLGVLYPALLAARMQPVEAMRGKD